MLLILPAVLNDTTQPPAHPAPAVVSDPQRHLYGHPDKAPLAVPVPARLVRAAGAP